MKMKTIKLTVLFIIIIILAGGLACRTLSNTSLPNPQLTNPPSVSQRATHTRPGDQPLSEGVPTYVDQPYDVVLTPTPMPGWPPAIAVRFPEEIGTIQALQQVSVALDKDSRLHAVIVSTDPTSTNGDIKYILYFASQNMPGSPDWSQPLEIFRIKASDWADQSLQASLVIVGDIPQVVTWFKGQAFYVSQDTSGTWSGIPLFDPASCPGCMPRQPVLVSDKQGQLYVVWADSASYSYYWQFKPLGGNWSSPELVKTIPDQTDGLPALAVDGEGTLHLAIKSGGDLCYLSKSINADWSESTPLDRTGSDPRLVADKKNTVHLVWWNYDRDQTKFFYMYKPLDGEWHQTPPFAQVTPYMSDYLFVLSGDQDLVLMWNASSWIYNYPWSYSVKKAGQFWSETGLFPNDQIRDLLTITSDQTGRLYILWRPNTGLENDFNYVMMPVSEIAVNPIAYVESTPVPPLGEISPVVGPGSYSDLSIGSRFIVWMTMTEQNEYDIWAYDLTKDKLIPVATQAGDQSHPSTSGDIIIWDDEQPTLPKVRGKNMATGKEFTVSTVDSPQFSPVIDGNLVVFEDWRKTGTCSWGDTTFGGSYSCDWDIWAVNLATKAEFPIYIGADSQSNPQVSGNWVLYTSYPEGNGNPELYIYQVDGSSPPRIIAGNTGYGPYDPALDGNLVVWKNVVNQVPGIYAYSLLNGSEFPIAIGSDTNNTSPDIQGNIVVWKNSSEKGSYIFGYNLATGLEFAISPDPGNRDYPVVYGDVVAWLNWLADGKTDITMARLPSLNGAQTQNFIPAPTSIPTPIPTNTPVPPVPPAPILLSPANGLMVKDLFPEFLIDLGAVDPYLKIQVIGLYYEYGTTQEQNMYCYLDSGPNLYDCDIGEELKPNTRYQWYVRVSYNYCSPGCEARSEVWSFTTPSQ